MVPNDRPWAYYQEWNKAFFLHWRVPEELIQPLIPANTSLDLFDGAAWISLVAFTMEKIRTANLPAWSLISTFHEINVRTYITASNRPGVYFLSIEAGKPLSAWISRVLSGMPYEYASMQRSQNRYTSFNRARNFQLDASFTIGHQIMSKSPLDVFLTEKYYAYVKRSGLLYRYEVHHKPWDLYHIEFTNLTTAYKVGDISLQSAPGLMHYSEGVQVHAWKPGLVTGS